MCHLQQSCRRPLTTLGKGGQPHLEANRCERLPDRPTCGRTSAPSLLHLCGSSRSVPGSDCRASSPRPMSAASRGARPAIRGLACRTVPILPIPLYRSCLCGAAPCLSSVGRERLPYGGRAGEMALPPTGLSPWQDTSHKERGWQASTVAPRTQLPLRARSEPVSPCQHPPTACRSPPWVGNRYPA